MNILFLCTGNSCRSQMAEGWARHLSPRDWEIQSAGIEAHGKNPRAIAVMKEAGIDISAQESTRVTDDMLESADLVVTVCGHADEHCPVLPPLPARNTGRCRIRLGPRVPRRRSWRRFVPAATRFGIAWKRCLNSGVRISRSGAVSAVH